MSNFIEDFLAYNCGTECPVNFLRWGAVSALSSAAGLRYSLNQGRLHITPITYIIFVAEQGVKKSYAKDQARDLLTEAFPDFPVGADVTTRDDLVRFLASETTERAYTDPEGSTCTYHPLALFIGEFKHFLSYNPAMMLSFIVDIFERKTFQCSTIKRGLEDIIGPCLTILACENTDWLIGSLKTGIITGGLSRRFIVVFEPEESGLCIPRPWLPSNHKEIWSRMVNHLRSLHTTSRRFTWAPGAEDFFDSWYKESKKKIQDDPNVRGFMRTKDQQLLKTCMLLDLAESKPTYTITQDLLELGLAMFAVIEPNMPKLYASAGRNELALPQQRMIEFIDSKGGIMTEKEVYRAVGKDLNPSELKNSIEFLCASDQLFKKAFIRGEDKVLRTWLISPKGMATKGVMEDIRRSGSL